MERRVKTLQSVGKIVFEKARDNNKILFKALLLDCRHFQFSFRLNYSCLYGITLIDAL
jgi:hypothetical protein